MSQRHEALPYLPLHVAAACSAEATPSPGPSTRTRGRDLFIGVNRTVPCVTCSRARDSDAQVSAVRASPDGQALALQRTPAFLEVVDTGSGRMLVASPARRGAPLLGFFWTAAPGADLVMATAAGLELCTLAPGGQARPLLCFSQLPGW